MTTLYTIKNLTPKQLRIIQDALDLKARVELGQIEDAIDAMKNENGNNRIVDWETKGAIGKQLREKTGLRDSNYWGVGKFPDSTDVAIDMYDVIRYHLSWDRAIENGLVKEKNQAQRDWVTMFSCNYDEPMVFGTEDPIIVEKQETTL